MLSEKCVGSFMCCDVGYILKSLLHYSVYQKGITNTGSIIGDCCICQPRQLCRCVRKIAKSERSRTEGHYEAIRFVRPHGTT
jgi:hypothetical protein